MVVYERAGFDGGPDRVIDPTLAMRGWQACRLILDSAIISIRQVSTSEGVMDMQWTDW
jgi:hypothetical protein